MKVVINSCFGGFGLSLKAEQAYLARKGKTAYFFKDARTADGGLDFDAPKVPITDLDENVFVSYTRTAPEPTWVNDDPAYFYDRDIPRDDPDLVAVVEDMGSDASGRHAQLVVIDIPDDADWEIAEYDGLEHVAEKHRTWA